MKDKQIISIYGRLGADPAWRDVGSGLCTFNVACSADYKDKNGEWQDHTEWYGVAVWGKFGQMMMEKLKKGQGVDVTGEVKYRTAEDGRVFKDIDGHYVYPEKVKGEPKPAASVPDDNDDLPFS